MVIDATKEHDDDALIDTLCNLPNESIYDGTRTAQPDEVWNYQRGDGLERAVALANCWLARHPEAAVSLDAGGKEVQLDLDGRKVSLPTAKGLEQKISL